MSCFETPLQDIKLRHIRHEGLIVDIGGGGEGLVSRVETTRVCAVDISLNKIREALIHGLVSQWLLSDGRALPVKDDVFDVATLWFSLGYIQDWKVKNQLMSELVRVLKPSGCISIIGAKIDCNEARFILRAHFRFPDGTVSQMSYGMRGAQEQNVDSVAEMLRQTGYQDIAFEDNGHWFRIDARVPKA